VFPAGVFFEWLFIVLHVPTLVLDECFLLACFVSGFLILIFCMHHIRPGRVFPAGMFFEWLFIVLHAPTLVLDECFLLACFVNGFYCSACTTTCPGRVFSAWMFCEWLFNFLHVPTLVLDDCFQLVCFVGSFLIFCIHQHSSWTSVFSLHVL
jgi:hypothetical protein